MTDTSLILCPPRPLDHDPEWAPDYAAFRDFAMLEARRLRDRREIFPCAMMIPCGKGAKMHPAWDISEASTHTGTAPEQHRSSGAVPVRCDTGTPPSL